MATIRVYDYELARGCIYESFYDEWQSTNGWTSITLLGTNEPPVFFENINDEDHDSRKITQPHVRAFIRHATGEHDSFGQDGEGGFKATGTATFQVFSPRDQHGLILSDRLCKVVAKSFRGKTGIDDCCGVVYRNVRVNEEGSDGRWIQANVLVDFEYDEDNS